MCVSRRIVRLSVIGMFLTILALLRQHSLTGIHSREGLQEIPPFNKTSQSTLPERYELQSISHTKTPYSSASSRHSDPFRRRESKYTRMLVVPRMKDDDTSWIAQELPDLNATIYVANDPSALLHPPKNKGHEVMVYLTYIIDHYHELPEIVIFMHAHRWTHHNNELLDNDATQMIKRLSNAHVFRQGYVNMRCEWDPGCPEWLHPESREENLSKQEEAAILNSWNELFPLDPLPKTLSQPCCAQFALSRQRIHSIPLSQFAFFRDWMLRTPLSDYISGRIWEYTWQYLFTHQSISCPAEHLCNCDAFGVCFGGAAEYGKYEDMRRKKLIYTARIEGLRQDELLISHPKPGERLKDANFSSVASNTYSHLHRQIRALERELAASRKNAIERGNDPKKRATECGRQWDNDNGI